MKTNRKILIAGLSAVALLVVAGVIYGAWLSNVYTIDYELLQSEFELKDPYPGLHEQPVRSYILFLAEGDLESAKGVCTQSFAESNLGSLESGRKTLTSYDWHSQRDDYVTNPSLYYLHTESLNNEEAVVDLGPIYRFRVVTENGSWKVDSVTFVGYCD